MACFLLLYGKINIKKPRYDLRFGFEAKNFYQVSKFCSEIIVFRGRE